MWQYRFNIVVVWIETKFPYDNTSLITNKVEQDILQMKYRILYLNNTYFDRIMMQLIAAMISCTTLMFSNFNVSRLRKQLGLGSDWTQQRTELVCNVF